MLVTRIGVSAEPGAVSSRIGRIDKFKGKIDFVFVFTLYLVFDRINSNNTWIAFCGARDDRAALAELFRRV